MISSPPGELPEGTDYESQEPTTWGCLHNNVFVINATELCTYERIKWSILCVFYYTHKHIDPTTVLAHTGALTKVSGMRE